MENLVEIFRQKKAAGRKLATLTAYDYPMGRLLDELDLDLILVGDSLGMVVLGHPDTTEVTLGDMVHHTKAVARGVTKTLLVADLSAHSADSPEKAVKSAKELIAAGARAVKIEGGSEIVPIVKAIITESIPVLGHIGMLPQRVREEGGYKIKGKTPQQADRLLEDARALSEAGVFGIVAELVSPPLAEEISKSIPIPTIGIGSGEGCDGQILVTYDLLGLFPWFKPKFVQPKADLASEIRRAVGSYVEDVRRA
jgi:3-methyl-2-oxobutanoate hydroxymethyltransferase